MGPQGAAVQPVSGTGRVGGALAPVRGASLPSVSDVTLELTLTTSSCAGPPSWFYGFHPCGRWKMYMIGAHSEKRKHPVVLAFC